MNLNRAQSTAVRAARAVGELLRRNLRSPKRANSTSQHDIKLELDVRSQALIEKALRAAFPGVALLGAGMSARRSVGSWIPLTEQ